MLYTFGDLPRHASASKVMLLVYVYFSRSVFQSLTFCKLQWIRPPWESFHLE